MAEITLKGYQCERCSHKWVPREEEFPKVCPKCKSPYWDTPRRINSKRQIAKKLDKIDRERLK